MRKLIPLAAISVLALSLAGCNKPAEEATTDTSAATETPPATDTGAATDESAAPADASADDKSMNSSGGEGPTG